MVNHKYFNESKIKCKFTGKSVDIYGRCTVCALSGEILVPDYLPEPVVSWVVNHPSAKTGFVRDSDIPLGFSHGKAVFTVKAKAVRNKKDKPDHDLGVRLAESRAKKKAYNLCRTLCEKIVASLEDQYRQYNEGSRKFSRFMEKELERQQQLLGKPPYTIHI